MSSWPEGGHRRDLPQRHRDGLQVGDADGHHLERRRVRLVGYIPILGLFTKLAVL
jgi:hypothetical protein